MSGSNPTESFAPPRLQEVIFVLSGLLLAVPEMHAGMA